MLVREIVRELVPSAMMVPGPIGTSGVAAWPLTSLVCDCPSSWFTMPRDVGVRAVQDGKLRLPNPKDIVPLSLVTIFKCFNICDITFLNDLSWAASIAAHRLPRQVSMLHYLFFQCSYLIISCIFRAFLWYSAGLASACLALQCPSYNGVFRTSQHYEEVLVAFQLCVICCNDQILFGDHSNGT